MFKVNSWDPSEVVPTAGHYVGEVVQRLGGTTKGGLIVLGDDNNTRMDTCVVRVMTMGPLPALKSVQREIPGQTLGGVGSGWVAPASAPWSEFPVQDGDHVWTSRDFPKVWIWTPPGEERPRKYVLGRFIDIIAVIDQYTGIADFEQIA